MVVYKGNSGNGSEDDRLSVESTIASYSLGGRTMTSREEKICVQFLELMHEQGGRHVKRLGPAVGPIVWKISQLPNIQWRKSYRRQMRFTYGKSNFKGRYSHSQKGRLEIVEVRGKKDGEVVATIDGLNTAMTMDLRQRLDGFIQHSQRAN